MEQNKLHPKEYQVMGFFLCIAIKQLQITPIKQPEIRPTDIALKVILLNDLEIALF